MKISIGSKIVRGPWGGGNLFAINLSNYLTNKGHEVIYDLSQPDIDLILLTDPRSRSESSSTFNHLEIEEYRKMVNPNVVVIQRINECDERKDTNNINNFYLDSSHYVDHVVFVSKWLRNIYVDIGMDSNKTSVILAGANREIFNNDSLLIWNQNEPLKIVTHHWSDHKNKGFDVYKQLDKLTDSKTWKGKIEFTYIGNVNKDYELNNTNIVAPLAGIELANEIKKHHIYVTGSINEPSGNHHIEAAQCGLPILYKNSGGIPEYCEGYGVSFSDDFETGLINTMENYELLIEQLKKYPFSSDKMCDEFFDLFSKLINQSNKDKIENFKIGLPGNWLMFKNRIMNKFRNNYLMSIRKLFKMYKKEI